MYTREHLLLPGSIYYCQGAFTIAREHLLLIGGLYFDICNISVFELLAVPQRGIPYVQIINSDVFLAVCVMGGVSVHSCIESPNLQY